MIIQYTGIGNEFFKMVCGVLSVLFFHNNAGILKMEEAGGDIGGRDCVRRVTLPKYLNPSP